MKFARKLLDALRDSIEVDLSPASENEVIQSPASPAYTANSIRCVARSRANQNEGHTSRLVLKLGHKNPDVDLMQVRRKADPAKGLVKEWVQNWRDARAVSKEVSYRKITGLK